MSSSTEANNRSSGLVKYLRFDEEQSRRFPIYPAVVYLLTLLILPLTYLFLLSVYTYDPIEFYIPEFTVENYARLWTDSFYRSVVFYTLRIAVIVSTLSLLLGYPVAHFLANARGKIKGILYFLVVLPLMVGVVVRSYGWIIILGQNGLVNQLYLILPGTTEPLSLLNSTEAVIIGLVGVLLPFMILPIQSSLEGIDPSLIEAARSLGADEVRSFLKITLPLSFPGILTGSIFCFTLSMSAIITPRLLGGRTDLTIGALIYDVALSSTNWPFGSALSVSLTVFTFSIIILYIIISSRYLEGYSGGN